MNSKVKICHLSLDDWIYINVVQVTYYSLAFLDLASFHFSSVRFHFTLIPVSTFHLLGEGLWMSLMSLMVILLTLV
jgi:hypothetical protein